MSTEFTQQPGNQSPADAAAGTEPPAAPGETPKPPEISADDAKQVLQQELDAWAQTRAEELNGQNINPLPLIISVELLQEKFGALVDELIASHSLNDPALAVRIAARLHAKREELRKVRVVRAVSSSLNGRDKKRPR